MALRTETIQLQSITITADAAGVLNISALSVTGIDQETNEIVHITDLPEEQKKLICDKVSSLINKQVRFANS